MQTRQLVVLIGIAIGVLLGGVGATWIDPAARAQEGAASDMAAEDVVASVSPMVVTVLNIQVAPGESSGQLVPAESGTGFIVDAAGYIVTNWHVVDGGQAFEVVFATGESRPAELVGADPLSDLAVVWVDGELPGVLAFGDSDAVRPGQSVLAIGSPLGSFTTTVTGGIISATGRDLPENDIHTNMIQHDAALNPGNSGGPLFNLQGEVIGVNSVVWRAASGEQAPGLSFAIPSWTVLYIADQLIQNGRVSYPDLDVRFTNITPDIAAQHNLPVSYGAFVDEVGMGGPGDLAGLLPGDIITRVGSTPIDATTMFSEALYFSAAGEVVELGVVRDGQERVLTATLGERPDDI
jgi:S1-C subfamily serine protease